MDIRLKAIIDNNKYCSYLQSFNISSYSDFKKLPILEYENLLPYIEKIKSGLSDVLFKGKPVSVEKTSGTLGAKYIYYSEAGIEDLKQEVESQYFDVINSYKITGKVFFALSPFWFNQEKYGELTVGLKDESVLSEKTLMHFMSHACMDMSIYLTQKYDDYYLGLLKLIRDNEEELGLLSIWSPSYFINILNDLKEYVGLKNNDKLVISCWTHGFAKNEVKILQEMLPLARIVPKGLFLTEGLVTRPILQNDKLFFVESEKNFIEYLCLENNRIYLRHELKEKVNYDVILTNNNGLYRYNTHDMVVLKSGSLEFIGRSNLGNDFAGEKISEEFLTNSGLDFFMYPDSSKKEYVIFVDSTEQIEDRIEQYLNSNPHWTLALNHKQIKIRFKKINDLEKSYFNYFIEKNATLSTVKKNHLIKNDGLFEYLEEIL